MSEEYEGPPIEGIAAYMAETLEAIKSYESNQGLYAELADLALDLYKRWRDAL